VSWNIRAGGGVRVPALAARLARWRPDVAALCEFRGTPPSAALARALAAQGLVHQVSTADPRRPPCNALLVASRWPLRPAAPARTPGGPREPARWLLAEVAAPRSFVLGVMHVPNRDSGRKWPYLDAVLALAAGWAGGPAVLLGDTNSGRPGQDEARAARSGFNAREGDFLDRLEAAGWRDAFRHLHGAARAYTWYSPGFGNGFRIDQAFLSPALLPELRAIRHAWGRRRAGGRQPGGPSDHAALLVDLA
jgi:exonuclease III